MKRVRDVAPDDMPQSNAAQHPLVPLQALGTVPEHILLCALRVLRACAAPLDTQLATLWRRMHAAVVVAVHP